MTNRQGADALAFAKRKWSSGPLTSGLTPEESRDALELGAAAVRAVFHVDVEDVRVIA